jgi:hypothetical protein
LCYNKGIDEYLENEGRVTMTVQLNSFLMMNGNAKEAEEFYIFTRQILNKLEQYDRQYVER